MKRTTTILAAMGALLLLSASVAVAATIKCDGGGCSGTGGRDTITGTANRDKISSGSGGDTIFGRPSADTIRAGFGADKIRGGTANDSIRGGSGPDEIIGGEGRDIIEGDNGNDTVRMADGGFDTISCGVGNDTAFVDQADVARQSFQDFVRLSSCENVTVRQN